MQPFEEVRGFISESDGEKNMETTMSLCAAESFEQVMGFYMPMVYRIAFARLADRNDAEDAVQDVFLRYIKANITYNDEEHRKAWLIRCAVNCTKNIVLSAWKRHSVSGEDILENMSSDDLSEEDDLEKFERRSAVMSAVMSLPVKYRTVIHLFYYEDMTVSQISKATGIKETTVKSQLSRAREMLKSLLKEVDF